MFILLDIALLLLLVTTENGQDDQDFISQFLTPESLRRHSSPPVQSNHPQVTLNSVKPSNRKLSTLSDIIMFCKSEFLVSICIKSSADRAKFPFPRKIYRFDTIHFPSIFLVGILCLNLLEEP